MLDQSSQRAHQQLNRSIDTCSRARANWGMSQVGKEGSREDGLN